jgi:hypothetical protein
MLRERMVYVSFIVYGVQINDKILSAHLIPDIDSRARRERVIESAMGPVCVLHRRNWPSWGWFD